MTVRAPRLLSHRPRDIYIDLIQYRLNLLNGTHQPAPSLRHALSTRLEAALQAMRTPVPGAAPTQQAPLVTQQRHGHQDPGFLFMDQVPDLGMLPAVSNLDVDSNVVAKWPPFLVNLFGYDNGGTHQPFQGPM
ncbi:hypothetical protein CspeluHIS016_0200550 [Cutaneotrichosporon spelunceum]|uniref:Uncharacterized protein n=1 Tax=Cutaneotrichosporon spelunceum TaxID=1672016 RepID=A0AAD3YAR7_9TREE|nr:hypothetical protein CspeluHIS016_0200550 [Cutaneotrichosporon spelunceum]